MPAEVHTYIHAYRHCMHSTYIHTYTCIVRAHVHTYMMRMYITYMHTGLACDGARTCVRTHQHVHTNTHTCIRSHIHECNHIHVYTHTHTHIHMYICTHAHRAMRAMVRGHWYRPPQQTHELTCMHAHMLTGHACDGPRT